MPALAGGNAFGDDSTASARNLSRIDQQGNHNSAFVDQSGTGGLAYIAQVGSWNAHWVVQTGADNFAKVLVGGDGNGVGPVGGSVAQAGSNNTAIALSAGNGNQFRLAQAASAAPNLAALVQKGDGNTASVDQNNPSLAAPAQAAAHFNGSARQIAISGPTLQIVQQVQGLLLGNANASLQIQLGDRNMAGLEQHGESNLAVQTQIGNDNAMSAQQIGDNNLLVHTQIGNGLVSPTIAQTGGMSMVITQWK